MTTSKIETTRKAEIYRTNLFWKVKLYLEDNSKNIDDYDIILDRLGDSEVIFDWDDSTGLSKPGSAELDPFDAAATAERTNFITRIDEGYPTIGEQLDLLYKDMTAGKLDTTGEWHKAIKKVKEVDYPKP